MKRKVDCLRDVGLIRKRWAGCFHRLCKAMSPTLDLTIVNELKVWPAYMPLDDVPFRYDVEEATRAMSKRKAVGPDDLLVDILKIGKGD